MNETVEHLIEPTKPGIKNTITYKLRNTAGASMHVHVGVDEFGVLNQMIINMASSGTTTHNLVNSLGRVISIAIQNDKATALQIVQTLEGMTSEVDWISDTLGRAQSIPEAISKILLKHIDIEEAIEAAHSGEETDDEQD
jgi:hypothetical protein